MTGKNQFHKKIQVEITLLLRTEGSHSFMRHAYTVVNIFMEYYQTISKSIRIYLNINLPMKAVQGRLHKKEKRQVIVLVPGIFPCLGIYSY